MRDLFGRFGGVLGVLLVLVGTTACSRTRMPRAVPAEHVVMFDRRGEPVELRTDLLSSTGMAPNRYRTQPVDWDRASNPFPHVIEGLHEPNAPRKVMIFIHGGLNTQRETLERARSLAREMGDVYPIFVNWDSSLISSYANEHLFRTRQGKEWPLALGILWSPVVMIGDLARGLTRAPLVWLLEAEAAVGALGYIPVLGDAQRAVRREIPEMEKDEDEAARRTGEVLVCRQQGCACGLDGQGIGDPQISVGTSGSGQLTLGAMARSLFWLPARLAISPLVEGAGAGAWDSMRRRVHLLFNNEAEFVVPPDSVVGTMTRGDGSVCNAIDCARVSALRSFLKALREEQCVPAGDGQSCHKLDITIVGHSMGAIVTNEILRLANFQAERGVNEVPEFSRVVYMAAAVSVRDYMEGTLPYLDRHRGTELYHLTLAESAENGERFPDWKLGGLRLLDVAPPGSLLVWIDQFLEDPDTLLDRTAGRATNLLHSYRYTPAYLRPQVYMKIFPGQGDDIPLRHGDFTDLKFWEPSFWKPVCGCGPDDDWYTCPVGDPAF